MKMTINDAVVFFRENDRFAILTHSYPDGDTVGSSAALCRILRKLGKTAHVVENPQIVALYAPLHQGLTIPCASDEDTLICVDVAAPHLLPDGFRPYLGRIALRIDHHGGDDHFSLHELVDSSCGACTELIYELACAMGVSLDAPTADALYTGTVTDTDCFRFANTTAHTLSVAAACVAAGAHNYEINRGIFENRLRQRLDLQTYIGNKMEIFADGRLAIVAIPLAVQAQIGADREDLNNILNFLQALSRTQVAATLLEDAPQRTRLSLRSLPEFDCSGVAAAFGGGGHRVSSGAYTNLDLTTATEAVKAEMLRQFGDNQ